MEIILASQSPYRRAQLESLGLQFTSHKPLIDEDAVKKQIHLSPSETALYLAKAKAQSLVEKFPQAYIIGSDQLVNLNGQILGKAASKEQAFAQLSQMSGKSHELITAVIFIHGSTIQEHIDITHLKMRKLSPAEITSYIDFANPLDCAGSYKLELGGYALIEEINSNDQSAIIGLPLIGLTNMLLTSGLPLPFVRH